MQFISKPQDKAPWDDSQNNPLVSTLSVVNSLGIGTTPLKTRQEALAALAPYVQSTYSIQSMHFNTVCTHLGYEIANFSTTAYDLEDFFLLGGARIDNFIKEKGYVKQAETQYVMFENNLPVAEMTIRRSQRSNYILEASGKKECVEDVITLACELVRPINESQTPERMNYIELEEYGYRDDPIWTRGEVHKNTIIHDEFYPFIQGGVTNLMRQFIASEENCMIWYGDPGTGKTSAIRAMIKELGILPVIAMKASVFGHKNFLRDIFAYSDETHRKNALNEKLAKIFAEAGMPSCLEPDRFAKYLNEKWNVPFNGAFETRVPIIVIEDADILLASRQTGNIRMNQLLNEVDGLGTSSSRKIIFTTNKTDLSEIDDALIRDGRSFGEFNFCKLTPEEAVIARRVAGLPDFEVVPTKPVPLATALKKPRQRFTVGTNGKVFGFASGT